MHPIERKKIEKKRNNDINRIKEKTLRRVNRIKWIFLNQVCYGLFRLHASLQHAKSEKKHIKLPWVHSTQLHILAMLSLNIEIIAIKRSIL